MHTNPKHLMLGACTLPYLPYHSILVKLSRKTTTDKADKNPKKKGRAQRNN
jgi:hypothetical protein